MTNHPGLVIAVDGPAGSGKSTAARGVARALRLRYLDTGSTYRALTWWLLARGVDVSEPDAVTAVLARGDDPPEPPAAVRSGRQADPRGQHGHAGLARGDDPPEPPAAVRSGRQADPSGQHGHAGLARGDDPPERPACPGRPVIEAGTDPDAPAICVDGRDVAGLIRTREVSNAVSAVASIPQVRRHLVAMQQGIIADTLAAGEGIVAEGRDIGTVVAPDAPVKVYLTASETVRARRRTADLAADPAATVAVTRAEQARRDSSDAPQMARAADAVEIDTTALGLDEVIREIVRLADCRRAGAWTR